MASTARYTTPTHDLGALLGRIMIAALFIPSGINKIMGFQGTVRYIASVGLPLPQAGAALTIVAEVGIALLLLVGYKTRWSALLLALFTVAAAVLFHNYWNVPVEKMGAQQVNFYKNIAIAGGLLAFAAFGAGRFSIDRH